MKRTAPSHAKDRELTKLHKQLSIRERQLAACVAGLKTILKFKSARQSVFVTEVELLQREAAGALARAYEIQSGRKLKQVSNDVALARGLERLLKLTRLNLPNTVQEISGDD